MSALTSLPPLTISSVRDGLRKKDFSAMELTEAALAFAQAENPTKDERLSHVFS